MTTQPAAALQRPYQEVGGILRSMISQQQYRIGQRLPPERELADTLNVSRTVVREALIMLEIEGLIEVKRGAGIFLLKNPLEHAPGAALDAQSNNAGPFEMLQARQLLESNIAEFAALQATREDIIKMRQALQVEEYELAHNGKESGDMQFHLAIAEATHNSLMVELFKHSWTWRENNPMWMQLHSRLINNDYRKEWLTDHKHILSTLVKKDPGAAKLAMWQHLENVKNRLLEFSDVDDINFDGYLFESWPLSNAGAAD